MNSDFLFTKPIDGYSVDEHLNVIEADISKSDWDAVKQEVDELEQYLDGKVIPYIQLSDERDNINSLKRNLAEIKAGIKSKDKGLALVSYENIKWDWNDLGN
jgi:hypothetical protein